MKWEQRFEKVHDLLELRVGSASGPLISWPDRGLGGRYTWSWQDNVPERRDITPFFSSGGNGPYRVKLWAKISRAPRDGTGDHQCDMDTFVDNKRKQRWEFDETEDHVVEVAIPIPITRVNIPYVVSLPLGIARDTLTRAGLIGVSTEPDENKRVTGQLPAAGMLVYTGSHVTLYT